MKKTRQEVWRDYIRKRVERDPDFHKKRYAKRKAAPDFREKRNRWANTENRRLRSQCLEKYGGKCHCCGETRQEFLAMDHIGGGGTQHRKELRGKYISIYRFLKQKGYPDTFRILCHNCNSSLGFYGYCPHKGIPETRSRG